jgi:hypothetical protein
VVIFLFKFQLIEKKIFIIPALLLDESMDWITHPGNDSAAFFRAKIQRRKKNVEMEFFGRAVVDKSRWSEEDRKKI